MKYLDDSSFSHAWNNMSKPKQKDLSGLIYECVYPSNKLIFDNVGKPGAYVYIPKFRLCDVLSTDDTSVHPAFIRNGVEVDGFYMGKFQSHVIDGRAYSLPAVDPSANMTLDQAVTYNRNKGRGFHEVTAAEWAAVALWCHKNGTEPRGNNNYGKDINETTYKAVPTSYNSDTGKIQHVATGTGPVTWSHDGTLEGIWDMNGNVHEWCTGLRLKNGELQVIPYNDAADPTCDFSTTSPAWKALYAAATTWDELFVSPYENPGFGTVKLDRYGTAWAYSTAINHATTRESCALSSVTADASIGDKARLMLMALAMLPDTGLTGDDIATNYNRDTLYVNNAKVEQYALRGAREEQGIYAGVFTTNLYNIRSYVGVGVGGRSAYQIIP